MIGDKVMVEQAYGIVCGVISDIIYDEDCVVITDARGCRIVANFNEIIVLQEILCASIVISLSIAIPHTLMQQIHHALMVDSAQGCIIPTLQKTVDIISLGNIIHMKMKLLILTLQIPFQHVMDIPLQSTFVRFAEGNSMSTKIYTKILSALETIVYQEGWVLGQCCYNTRSEFYYRGCKFVVVVCPSEGRDVFKVYCEYHDGNDVTYSQFSRTYLGETNGDTSPILTFANMLFSDIAHESRIIRRKFD